MPSAITTTNVGTKDYVKIGEATAYKLFHKKVIDFEQKCTKERVPFCRKCVLDIWQDKYKMILLNLRREITENENKEIDTVKIETDINFEDFTNGHFSLKDVREKWVQEKRQDKKYFHINFICKSYGYGCVLTMTEQEYDQWKQKEGKTKQLS